MSGTARVALVTGAASGIGAACAARLAAAGMKVAGLDLRPPAPSDAAHPVGIVWWGEPTDVSDANQVAASIRQIVAELGEVEVLVNAAGVGGSGQYVLETPLEELARVIAVDLIGPVLVAKLVLQSMVRRGRGSIVNVSSVAGLEGAPGHLPYSAAKAGLINATRSMAWEYGRQGIRVNCVCPGLIRTPMTSALFDNAEVAHQMIHWAALRRAGEPSEVAAAVAFLVSDEASFVTGHCMIVDGGWTAGRDQIPPSALSN